jgi:hypothetical protein
MNLQSNTSFQSNEFQNRVEFMEGLNNNPTNSQCMYGYPNQTVGDWSFQMQGLNNFHASNNDNWGYFNHLHGCYQPPNWRFQMPTSNHRMNYNGWMGDFNAKHSNYNKKNESIQNYNQCGVGQIEFSSINRNEKFSKDGLKDNAPSSFQGINVSMLILR